MQQFGKKKSATKDFIEGLATNILKEDQLQQTKKVKPLINNNLNRLRNQFNLVSHEVETKERELEMLKREYIIIKDQCYSGLKFQKIMNEQDIEYEKQTGERKGATTGSHTVEQSARKIEKMANKDLPPLPELKNKVSHLEEEMEKRNMAVQFASASSTSNDNKNLELFTQLPLHKIKARQTSQPMNPKDLTGRSNASYLRTDLDAGIPSTLFQPSFLLARKAQLIKELEESKYKADRELLDRNSLKYMFDRIRGQQEYEIAISRELDPYFQFQTKIHPKLDHIRKDHVHRDKIKEKKMKEL